MTHTSEISTPSRRCLHLIVSSMSAGGRALHIGPQVARILRAGGWKVEVTVTTLSDDPVRVAQESSCDVVAALGGDGFVAAVARGCHEGGRVFAPIPSGRGNDLCRALNVGADPLTRARSLAELGLIHPGDDDSSSAFSARLVPLDGMWVLTEGRKQLVLGIVSLGLDARANLIANESSINGPLAYPVGAFAAVRRYRPQPIVARVDGVERDLTGWITSVSNSGCVGGGIVLVPQSDPCDGVIELSHVPAFPMRRVLPELVKAVSGRGANPKYFTVERVTEVEFLDCSSLTAMADGDRVAEAPFTVRGAPHVVNVLI